MVANRGHILLDHGTGLTLGYAIGIDVGGTTSTIAVGNAAQEVVLISDQFDSLTRQGPATTIEAISNQILASLERLGVEPTSVDHIGLATPGPATFDGVLLKTVNLDAELWDRFAIREALEARLRRWSPNASVHYIGDGQAAALGEFSIRTGSVRWQQLPDQRSSLASCSSLFMVIVGTGLGGGGAVVGELQRHVVDHVQQAQARPVAGGEFDGAFADTTRLGCEIGRKKDVAVVVHGALARLVAAYEF